MFLLDTNVISELRRVRPHGAVVQWLMSVDEADLYVSAVTIGELQAGVELTRRQDPLKAVEIDAWVDRIAEAYNILTMEPAAFRQWARFLHGRSPSLTVDAMIAATADVHGLVVVTRNIKDFEVFGVKTLNPFVTR